MTEQTTVQKVKSNVKKTDSVVIRFDKSFMKQLTKIVDKANRKQFGRKIKPKNIIVELLNLADESLISKVLNNVQDKSLSTKDQKAILYKNIAGKFKGSIDELELKLLQKYAQEMSQAT